MAKHKLTIQREQLGEITNLVTSAAQARHHFRRLGMDASADQADHLLSGATALLVEWPRVSQESIDSMDSRNRELWDAITEKDEEAGAV